MKLLWNLMLVMSVLFICTCQTGVTGGSIAEVPNDPDISAEEPAPVKVLLVHSYHTGYPWVDAITRGVRMALSGSNIDLEIYYMDTKRNTSEEWKVESGNNAMQVVRDWEPDVIIAADDNAQKYFAVNYIGMEKPQIVFCGVNAEPEAYGYPASNVTGILERPHFNESLDLLNEIMPGVENIAIISDDSPTSQGALSYMRAEDTELNVVSTATPSTFQDWQDEVRRVQDLADAIAIYMYHTVKPADGMESMDPKEVMVWTVENSNIPIVGFFVFAVDDGALCGFLESGAEQGMRAGEITLQIIGGMAPGDMPVVTALEGQSMLNVATATRLGLNVPDAMVDSIDIVLGE